MVSSCTGVHKNEDVTVVESYEAYNDDIFKIVKVGLKRFSGLLRDWNIKHVFRFLEETVGNCLERRLKAAKRA